jgi:radical SAM superfamily enzyme YgiQ (UPF0313 family)
MTIENDLSDLINKYGADELRKKLEDIAAQTTKEAKERANLMTLSDMMVKAGEAAIETQRLMNEAKKFARENGIAFYTTTSSIKLSTVTEFANTDDLSLEQRKELWEASNLTCY